MGLCCATIPLGDHCPEVDGLEAKQFWNELSGQGPRCSGAGSRYVVGQGQSKYGAEDSKGRLVRIVNSETGEVGSV